MKRIAFVLVTLCLCSSFGTSEASAGHRSHWGISIQTGPGSGYVYASPGRYVAPVAVAPACRSRGHYDFYPGSYVRHHGHYDYIPPHYHYHRGGHHGW